MIIKKNTVVSLCYQLHDDKGQSVDPGHYPMVYLHGGYHGIFSKIEAALEGKAPGQHIDITLLPQEHFGEKRETLIYQAERARLPADIALNTVLEGYDENTGETKLVHVAALNDTHATLDGNHPLAGMTLRFSARVQSVRPATAEEIAHGHAHSPLQSPLQQTKPSSVH